MPTQQPKRQIYKRRTAAERARDDERFLELHLQKYSYRQIAELVSQESGFEISYQTVFNSVKAQTTEWKKVNQATINRAMLRAEAVLSLIERKAWEGFARSCEDAVKTTTERKLPALRAREDDDDDFAAERFAALVERLTDDEGRPPIVKEIESREGQAGDSGFLRVITYCQHVRIKLFEAVTIESQLPDALIKLAKAMGVRVDDDAD